MPARHTTDELLAELGQNLRALRLDRNLDQATVAERAGVSTHALKNLEHGVGATVRTLVQVLRALEREDWLASLAPLATINPLTMPRSAEPRQRASRRKDARGRRS
jgi:transcriptional regulator with XRE-family HTH domain